MIIYKMILCIKHILYHYFIHYLFIIISYEISGYAFQPIVHVHEEKYIHMIIETVQ